MPSITRSFDWNEVPQLAVYVSPTKDQGEETVSEFFALIDTGASHTHISPIVVSRLGLIAGGYSEIVTAKGPVSTGKYSIDLAIPFEAHREWRRDLIVYEFAHSPYSTYQILLGRDVLCDGHLTLSLDGRLVFSL